MQEKNEETEKNQVNNEEMSLDDNVETCSDFSELTESYTSKVNKDDIAMNKQFAEQLSFYNDIQPSCNSIQMSKIKTSGDNSQLYLQEAVADVDTVKNHINKEDACSDVNVEIGSDSSEVRETVPSQDIENDLNKGSKKNEVAMNEMFANQLSIYKKVKPNSDTKPEEKLNERKSITFSLVNDDLLEKYFKDDSASKVKETNSINESF